jgi:hypothetical protein
MIEREVIDEKGGAVKKKWFKRKEQHSIFSVAAAQPQKAEKIETDRWSMHRIILTDSVERKYQNKERKNK